MAEISERGSTTGGVVVSTATRPTRAADSSGQGRPTAKGRAAPRRWPWIVALAVVGLLICGAGYVIFISSLLGLRTVTITGVPDDVAAQIRTIAPAPDGFPLARIDLDGVRASVDAVPQVSEAEVSRAWPGTLTIAVTPRVPSAVTSANGQLWLLDASGDPYLAVTAPPAGLVTVQLVAPRVGDPSTAAALTVAAALTPPFRPTVAAISARTPFDIELTLKDGRKVLWGEATESAQKMQVLPALLAAQDGKVYDITDPTLVTVR